MAGHSISDLRDDDLDTSKIKTWPSIVTLVVFVVTNVIVLFPFHIPFYFPRAISTASVDALAALRIIPPRRCHPVTSDPSEDDDNNGKRKPWVRFRFPMNFVTAPLIADLFLLAIQAIGRREVHDGTIGADNISPIDIMAFFITLAYIAISIDASGLIRYLAFKVLQYGGKVGHKLFFYLYAFFFVLGSFIGNDPIILSGTAFLAYMTRVSSNIVHPRAWIHSQFAVANIASAILVSSNPTNLVLAGAFEIRFITYTANMIVPVVVTAIVLFPCLLYVIFANEALIPVSIRMHELSEEEKAKKPVNPNIPNARVTAEDQEELGNEEEGKRLSLEEIMNPFLDKGGAAFGAVIMTATLVTLLALNAASQSTGEHPVFWVTLPAAFVMFCWDVAFGWYHRKETREIAQRGRQELEQARADRAIRSQAMLVENSEEGEGDLSESPPQSPGAGGDGGGVSRRKDASNATSADDVDTIEPGISRPSTFATSTFDEKQKVAPAPANDPSKTTLAPLYAEPNEKSAELVGPEIDPEMRPSDDELSLESEPQPTTLVSLVKVFYRWCQESFPTVTAVLAHLPWALVPFAFAMFVLVQALKTKGWVPVFAYGWDHWVDKTGTVGAIGGMGFVSVMLCNFAGTNIGTTILLSRIIQAWQQIHIKNGTIITDRTFWGTVYSMAIGVNYGAFSTSFSASLAGLLWRDILARKHIRVRELDFAYVNVPIIAISMTVGCAVLIGQIYIIRDTEPYR
ncbi:hypothetical protein P152DRAFT_171085 [Eremomyces bilateralis CBS 781.70]|uniref:Citrate transporter-like domain-containing protein n=1 Tax=Eremomyces bilateralis CBS 781.70 TaxID=1392243 RepID=A0A6G1FTW4_9PEZI|nr:uncharacterized protein P152DRAFT_171085 [Eremomyces bilateralis CBS 781.70]KAF1809148.1 hypothetical protein P152DRAFT_171085 [Eremomyces bilateralis CBS 781.70]